MENSWLPFPTLIYAVFWYDGIPAQILLKPGKLDPREMQIMKMHTTIGAEILKGSMVIP